MARYVAINVGFTEEEHERLRHLAVYERRSMTDTVREAVSTYLKHKDGKTGKTLTAEVLGNDPFFKVIGIGHSKVTDASTRHDEIIYGLKKEPSGRNGTPCSEVPNGGDQGTGRAE